MIIKPGGREDILVFPACQAPVGYSPRGLGPGTNPRPEALGVGWTGTQRSPTQRGGHQWWPPRPNCKDLTPSVTTEVIRLG